MTNQEAIKFIQERVDIAEKHYPDMKEYHDALVMAVAALKKQEPMEYQDEERTTVKAFDGGNTVLTYKAIPCPSCGKWISVRGAQKNYCQFCGQALDWKEGD